MLRTAGEIDSVFRSHVVVTGHRVVSWGGGIFCLPGPAVAALTWLKDSVIPVGHGSLKCVGLLGANISKSVQLTGQWKQIMMGLFQCV